MTTKIAQVHQLFKDHPNEKYCVHNIIQIYNLPEPASANILGKLRQQHGIELVESKGCNFSNRVHRTYTYKGKRVLKRVIESNVIVRRSKKKRKYNNKTITQAPIRSVKIVGPAEVRIENGKTIIILE